ncbi:BZ3500_MvSof-1268-A1-R1_Chr3-1g05804 [Microbotryum saponariae]|uniref:BZ3500_MvSof-1268-A1-R1_Chr3-1g05804 protein n=1 Tax=Microbotryum saponariae TaxID=289078 RepID=A0A2X0LDF5_9BASI|nr:BZ3500_MvSof-1268-A1-R1_Chr3-1g05804 [Microbotryum saponariae]SDA04994.1 BZ3501_MvSof-1269-A2-R1_Chr3-1g05474 [Microbotryum saponariae]
MFKHIFRSPTRAARRTENVDLDRRPDSHVGSPSFSKMSTVLWYLHHLDETSAGFNPLYRTTFSHERGFFFAPDYRRLAER